jgi:hypothetical protein
VEHQALRDATWHKAGTSGDGNCVEVATTPLVVGVRDTKDRTGPMLTFEPGAWIDFVAGVKDGEFDRR